MKLNDKEIATINEVERSAELQVLDDMQLALVGGGMGDTVL